MAPKTIRPYVDSALKLDTKKISELKNVDEFLQLLGNQKMKNKNEKSKDEAFQVSNNDKSDNQEKTVFIGLKEVFKNLKRETLGVVILDESLTQLSTASQFFSLMVSAQKTCTFYTVKDLSDKASKLLNINQVSAVGLRKNHPFLKSLGGHIDVESNASSKTSFKKPTFTVPVGKKDKKTKKVIKKKKVK